MLVPIYSKEKIDYSDMLELNDDNFDNEVYKNNTKLFVTFYAEWCHHCHALLPELSKASKLLIERKSKIKLAKIDCHANGKSVCGVDRFNISGYPTLKYFLNGQPNDYKGSRASQDLVMWLLKFGLEKNVYCSDPSEIQSLVEIFPLTTIYFGKKGTSNFTSFELTTKENSESAYGYCDTEECLNYYNVTEGQLVIFNSLNVTDWEKIVRIPREEIYDHEHDIIKLIDVYSAPLVQEFGYKTSKIAYIHKINMIYFFCEAKDNRRNDYIEAMRIAAQNYKGTFQFVISDIDLEHQGRLARMLGIKKREMPIAVLHDTLERKFKLESGFTNSTSYINFIELWKKNDTLVRYYKSEDPYPDQHKYYIKNVTAIEFKDFIEENHKLNKDVLVIFYAAFSEQSQKFLKYLNEVESLYRGLDITFALMDYRANEMPELYTRSYPIINLYKTNKEIKRYQGEPENKELFLNFLAMYTKAKLPNVKKPEEPEHNLELDYGEEL